MKSTHMKCTNSCAKVISGDFHVCQELYGLKAEAGFDGTKRNSLGNFSGLSYSKPNLGTELRAKVG